MVPEGQPQAKLRSAFNEPYFSFKCSSSSSIKLIVCFCQIKSATGSWLQIGVWMQRSRAVQPP